MRIWLLAYGALYVVVEMVGHRLETIGWPRITALDVATAVTDAFLTVSITLAVLLAGHLALRRWSVAATARLLPAAAPAFLVDRPIGVRSWRAEPLALPAAPPARDPYSVGAYGPSRSRRGRRVAPDFPEEPGRLL
ncbi:hypothetical protein E9549_02955 [Blastococcus sp. MG754426]|uniref:hypothetical protein n=1 Tax=unclassified Blastococcus TaxID=2619396 RepID=UPI001EF12074|nr:MULTISPECIES: hypothetical protein [unclassified Blastococcus]MCF6506372.1 hypothetical protein [Blastococcus sp. MG754426]MCF6510812.1 hypothetical protein [Blastococcus sp. MG754427]MCF6733782.1 hypothetical protein [Blastococcus sp. KM273129]